MIAFENIPSFRFLTRNQKHRIFRIPPILCLLAQKSRREGLLSLEEGIDDLVGVVDKRDEWFLKEFLRMILDFDGKNREDLPVIMKNIVTASGGSKLSILCHQMIASGSADIWEGRHENSLLDNLVSFLGKKWQDDFFVSPELRAILRKINCRYSVIVKDENEFLYPETDEPCENHPLALILDYSEFAIQKVLREVDTEDLVLALKDAPAKIRNAFLKNMSERARCCIKIKLDDEGEPYDREKIPKAQQMFIHIIRRHEDAGKI